MGLYEPAERRSRGGTGGGTAAPEEEENPHGERALRNMEDTGLEPVTSTLPGQSRPGTGGSEGARESHGYGVLAPRPYLGVPARARPSVYRMCTRGPPREMVGRRV